MADARIASSGDQPAQPTQPTTPDWYPWPELGPLLSPLTLECDGLAADVARVIAETGATLDALIADAEQQFQRLRDAHTVIRELDDEQAGAILRKVREGGAP